MDALGSAGSQAIGWKDNQFKPMDMLVGEYVLPVQLQNHCDSKVHVLMSAYGPGHDNARSVMLNAIPGRSSLGHAPFLLASDFNLSRLSGE